MDQRKLIYNSIANLINDSRPEVFVTQRRELIPETLPCVLIEPISKIRTRRYACLDNSDDQCRLTFEVNVFDFDMNSANALMECVEDSFKQLSFFEELCRPLETVVNRYRIVARFSAQLGGTL